MIFALLQHCMLSFSWHFLILSPPNKDARLGGRVLSCGKLDGAMEALDLECTSRDVLLVTSQLGDLIEAALGIQGGKMLRN